MSTLKQGEVIHFQYTHPYLDIDFQEFPWLRQRDRYYKLDRELTPGKFGETWTCFPCDQEGEIVNYTNLVLKRPRIDTSYSAVQIGDRISFYTRKASEEIRLFRARLRNCDRANVVFDAELKLSDYGVEVYTVQKYLAGMSGLRHWLNDHFEAQCDRCNSDYCWKGATHLGQIVPVAKSIANALAAVHNSRVTHGDVHPGNIFVDLQNVENTRLIDFGGAFLSSRNAIWQKINPHIYLAPERTSEIRHLNEWVDTYSFGVLLLFLLNGEFDPSVKCIVDKHVRRRERWTKIQNELLTSQSKQIIYQEPRFFDIVLNCIDPDPSDRPRMIEVVDDLKSFEFDTRDIEERHATIERRLLQCLNAVKHSQKGVDSKAVLSVVEKQVEHLEHSLHGLKTEMMEVHGTRRQVLKHINAIMDGLTEGDSWSSVTTMEIWQRHALGLSGSFMTSSARAVRRGVSLRRVYLVAISELGKSFSTMVADRLSSSKDANLALMGKRFAEAVKDYRPDEPEFARADKTPQEILEARARAELRHRNQFYDVLDSLVTFVERFDLANLISKDLECDIQTTKGLWFDLHIMPHRRGIEERRFSNPYVLIFTKAGRPDQNWHLLHTEIEGRGATNDEHSWPTLLSLRTYTSIFDGVPQMRIDALQQMLKPKEKDQIRGANLLSYIVPFRDAIKSILGDFDGQATNLIRT